MYQHLKLFNLKGLKESALNNLGHINIICGKNNTGKSTILEAIVSEPYRAYGIHLTPNDGIAIYEGSVRAAAWEIEPNHDKAYKGIILSVIANRNIWYSNQTKEFFNEIQHLKVKNGLISSFKISERAISEEYNLKFLNTNEPILIPPKRQLELEKQIQGKDEFLASGIGILNYLFLARNQPEGSEEKGLYQNVKKAFELISGGYTFDIFMRSSNSIVLNFAYGKQTWIPAKDCGLGLQDLLVMIWFSIYPKHKVILIEEPESHIHPDMQRRLLSFFREQTDKQYFLTTHSNIFVNNAYVDKVDLIGNKH